MTDTAIAISIDLGPSVEAVATLDALAEALDDAVDNSIIGYTEDGERPSQDMQQALDMIADATLSLRMAAGVIQAIVQPGSPF